MLCLAACWKACFIVLAFIYDEKNCLYSDSHPMCEDAGYVTSDGLFFSRSLLFDR